MILVERHIIKNNHKNYDKLTEVCHLSKNLYNVGLYNIRQEFINNKKYLSYNKLANLLAKENNIDYRALPANTSQQTLMILDKNFKSFFALLKKKNTKVKLPRYLKKDGEFVVTYTKQSISDKFLKKGYIKLTRLDFSLKTLVNKPKSVRIVPKGNHIVIEVLYEKQENEQLIDNKRYLSIDLGVNNLATIGSNVIKPVIVNGKPLKSINQYYNKKISQLKFKSNNHIVELDIPDIFQFSDVSNWIKSITDVKNDKTYKSNNAIDYINSKLTVRSYNVISNDISDKIKSVLDSLYLTSDGALNSVTPNDIDFMV